MNVYFARPTNPYESKREIHANFNRVQSILVDLNKNMSVFTGLDVSMSLYYFVQANKQSLCLSEIKSYLVILLLSKKQSVKNKNSKSYLKNCL